ncbi:MAG: hypothetical protein R3A50_16695 [Saprospiraceae bacterium]
MSKVTTNTKSSTVWPFLIVATCFLIGIALIIGVLLKKEAPSPELQPKEKAKLEQKIREIDDSEQYALIANNNGWYPCLHSGRSSYYLLKGEIWKYGVTSKGQFGRYTVKFLRNNNVSYIIEFKGNMAECLKMEQIKLFNYPFLPENMTRPINDRLPRPPYNPIMR